MRVALRLRSWSAPLLRRFRKGAKAEGRGILVAACGPYSAALPYEPMTATITGKGQITIPLRVRQKLNLKAGDQLEFDESASVLAARRVVEKAAWRKTVAAWQKSAAKALKGHVWEKRPSASIIDDLRGGPVQPARR